jgi:hypothetical protein
MSICSGLRNRVEFIVYSFRNESTGFAIAAFIDSKLTVIKAMEMATKPAHTNTIHCTGIR